MRNFSTQILATIVLALLASSASAATYYISPSGNDSNNGTSQSTPWRTIARLQSLEYIFAPGDQILFERGGSYPGQLNIGASGTASQPIVVGAYGTGAIPEISGAITPTNWTLHQGNIWRASVSQPVKYVHVGGNMMTLARYPNTGWLRVNTSNNTTLNSAGLTQANNYWNGSELVIRTTGFCYENAQVSGSSNGNLTFSALGFNPGNYQWGFFLQNKLSELDTPGEWYHDATAGVLYFNAPGNVDPNTLQVKASVYENGVMVGWQRSYINIQDISFKHQRYAGVFNSGGDHVNITGCTFKQNLHGIRSYGSYGNYSNNTVRNTYATGLGIIDHHTTIASNLIEDIALVPGFGEPVWGYYGMFVLGQENIIRSNTVTNTGNSAIFIEGGGVVEKNVITRALATVNDGGGIYFDNANGLIIQDNFVSDLDGNMESIAMDHGVNFKIGHGIYFGNAVINDVIVRRNTVHGCHGAGVNVDHTMVSSGLQVRDNVLYDNDIQLSITDLSNYNGPGATYPYYVANYNDVYSGNTLYCTNKDQHCMQQYLVHGVNPVDFGTHTNNRYFNPFNEQSIYIINIPAQSVRHLSLDQWRASRNEETGSTISPHRQNANEVVSRLNTNMLANGAFDANINGWAGWPTTGQLTRDATFLDNGALKVVYGTNTASSEFYLRNEMMNVQNNEWYEMRFSTQSNIRGVLRAEFKGQSQASSPLSISSREVSFGPQRRDEVIVFKSDRTEPGQMIFANQYTESTYWIDNVEMYRVTVQAMDPYERHILVKNPTNSAVTVPLNGCWSDVNGGYHTNSIDIPAWGSVVLAKEEPEVCGLTTAVEENEVAKADGVRPYPNPLLAGGQLFLTSAVSTDTEVEVIDASGRSIVRARMVSGSTEVPVGSNLISGHYILLLRNNGVLQRHRLVVQ